MDPNYNDIRSRIAEEPTWFSRGGVPRYGAFEPGALGVYDQYAILAEIQCQSCRVRIKIGLGYQRFGFYWGKEEPVTWSMEGVAEAFAYGDPPRHGCPGAGETMSSDDLRIIEAWEREDSEWVRRPEHERILWDD